MLCWPLFLIVFIGRKRQPASDTSRHFFQQNRSCFSLSFCSVERIVGKGLTCCRQKKQTRHQQRREKKKNVTVVDDESVSFLDNLLIHQQPRALIINCGSTEWLLMMSALGCGSTVSSKQHRTEAHKVSGSFLLCDTLFDSVDAVWRTVSPCRQRREERKGRRVTRCVFILFE